MVGTQDGIELVCRNNVPSSGASFDLGLGNLAKGQVVTNQLLNSRCQILWKLGLEQQLILTLRQNMFR